MNEASNFVKGVDLSLAVVLGISVFFLVGITAFMIYFLIRYRKKKNPKATNIKGSHTLEILWTVIPTILVLVMFYYGWAGFQPMRNVPDDAIPVKTYGQMWNWSFEYPNGKISDSLVVPLDQPVVLDLISRDVLHSFYVPAFRIKEDVVPGIENKMWFIAQQEGEYDILCAEYCGQRHSYMLSKVVAVPEQEYEKWLSDTTASAAEQEYPGLAVMKANACFTCHSRDGTKLVGPTFKGLWNRNEVVVTNGEEREITVDEEYIRRSIYEPNADIVKGYNKGLMISYKEQIDDEQMEQIIEYLKTLK